MDHLVNTMAKRNDLSLLFRGVSLVAWVALLHSYHHTSKKRHRFLISAFASRKLFFTATTRIEEPVLRCNCPPTISFHLHHKQPNHYHLAATSKRKSCNTIAVPASELEKDLSDDEKTVVSVVRKIGPSVAFVTSVWPLTPIRNDDNINRRQGRNRRRSSNNSNQHRNGTSTTKNVKNTLPLGQNLGSGSGFVVDKRGYIVTNYHVIERAYQIIQNVRQIDNTINNIIGNVTKTFPVLDYQKNPFINSTIHLLESTGSIRQNYLQRRPIPEVYVRIDSATEFIQCYIVDVKPESDLAVLKVLLDPEDDDSEMKTTFKAVDFGSSSSLLVGQTLIAIGNPFGLDNTVTTGVVSALDREVRTVRNEPPLQSCIQTDCAINPGNSGGPLLSRKGEVVGINTAILSNTGTNTGIGFAVPSDQVQPIVEQFIRADSMLVRDSRKRKRKPIPYLGVTILKQQQQQIDSSDIDSIITNGTTTKDEVYYNKYQNWITSVQPNSPAFIAGIEPIQKSVENDSNNNENAVVGGLGDAIIAIGGNSVLTYNDVYTELIERRFVNETISITLFSARTGDKRVVYVTLQERPINVQIPTVE